VWAAVVALPPRAHAQETALVQALSELTASLEGTYGDEGARTRAYTLAGAFVRDLMREHGSSAPGDILARMPGGTWFDDAFVQVIGHRVSEEETAFWERHRFWNRWGPFFTTTTALWMGVTVLALVAIVRRRQKSAALRQRWESETETEDSQ